MEYNMILYKIKTDLGADHFVAARTINEAIVVMGIYTGIGEDRNIPAVDHICSVEMWDCVKFKDAIKSSYEGTKYSECLTR